MKSMRAQIGVFLPLLFFLGAFLSVHAAPLNYDIIDPSRNGQTHEIDKDIAALHQAKEDANHQIDRMHYVVENHHKPYNNLILTKAFGKSYNIHEIKKNVGLLKSSTVKVATVRNDIGGGNAKTTRPDGHLHLDHRYYTGKTDRERAGTLIHEAAHSLFNTHDHFTNEADPSKIRAVSSKEKKKLEEAQMAAHKAAKKVAQAHNAAIPKSKHLPPVTLSGYVKQSDYNHLKAKASHVMHHNSDSYKVLGHLSTYGLLAPMDKDRGHRSPLVDNKGVPSKIVKHGGSKIPISTQRLSDAEHPAINPYTSKPLRMPKTHSEHKSSSDSHTRPDGAHPPSKIPVHSHLEKIRKEKAKAERLSSDARLKVYNHVAHGAHENHHILQTGVHAQNSRRKDVVREKPLPPLPHEMHGHTHVGSSHGGAHHSPAAPNHHAARPASRSQSRQGAHTPHGGASKPSNRVHRPPTPKRANSTLRPKGPVKRPSSPKQPPHKH